MALLENLLRLTMVTQKQEQFKVSSSSGDYDVVISNNEELLISNLNECKFFIADSFFKESFIFENIDKNNIFFVDASEDSKTLSFAEQIIHQMTLIKLSRDSKIAVIGGGIIQDVGGFIASIYMRGIEYKLYPTTYLSMVDSCIGGKTSINTKTAKNLLGTFYPPKEVFCFSDFCKTLNVDQINQGLVEALKITFAYQKFFQETLKLTKDYNSNLLDICKLSLFSKKAIIQEDEFDLGQRRLLNLGHTFGHSIEKASSHEIEHGYAVGLGILIAKNFSSHENLIKLGSNYDIEMACTVIKKLLPYRVFVSFSKMDMKIFFDSLESDKKHNNIYYRFILPINNHIKEIEFEKKLFNLEEKFIPIIKQLHI